MEKKEQPDLFAAVPGPDSPPVRLDGWPNHERFPFNFGGLTVDRLITEDLLSAADPLVITGFSSLDRIVSFLGEVSGREGPATVRIMLGSEPVASTTRDRVIRDYPFPREVEDYWLERGFSVRLGTQVLQAIELIRTGRVKVRYLDETYRRLHAKIYAADRAVTLGSSNFSEAGLRRQLEVNARFTREGDRRRYREARALAEEIWRLGRDYREDLIALLEKLLRAVTWQEALAKAVADLLYGEWAARYTGTQAGVERSTLWPSQETGIAQALWMIDNVGSVLVADATGAGKTRMGAHLMRAVMDRIWSTGRIRRDIPVLVCPPDVQRIWETESRKTGLPLGTHSHGLLSRRDSDRRRDTVGAIRRAQILAIDEAHNFLNLQAERTRGLMGNMADHVVMFTATPINRGAGDFLRIIDMLGADNLDDEALRVFEHLSRRQGGRERQMTGEEREALRREIQRFTLRRTKAVLNTMVDREPERFVNELGNPCRYPRHDSRIYETGETEEDRARAREIRRLAKKLRGLVNLQSRLELPDAFRREGWSEDRYLDGRLRAAGALAVHQVMANLRSSRAALIEHLYGTGKAREHFGITETVKAEATGNILGTIEGFAGTPPENLLDCPLPAWLEDPSEHRKACAEEMEIYGEIGRLTEGISAARAETKARHLAVLMDRHPLLIAFDSRLITLFEIRRRLVNHRPDLEVIVATGTRRAERNRINELFRLGSSASGVVALCSDAMSEGLNLQQASAVVQLDLPSVVRIAEQRVGRVDRMDSPHRAIEAWWPKDTPEFALRADEKFVERHQTVEALLGSNMPLPEELLGEGRAREAVITADEMIERLEALDSSGKSWDGIRDAFGPVRDLVQGPEALLEERLCEEMRGSRARILSAVSVVAAEAPWGFFAVAGHDRGAPRWVFMNRPDGRLSVHLDSVCEELRKRLSAEVTSRTLDDDGARLVERFIDRISAGERELLPRKKQRALDEMERVLAHWIELAGKEKDYPRLRLLSPLLEKLTRRDRHMPFDLDTVAERWLDLIRPVWYEKLADRRRRTPLRLKDIRRDLKKKPLATNQLDEAFSRLPTVRPIEERIVACIVGIPGG